MYEGGYSSSPWGKPITLCEVVYDSALPKSRTWDGIHTPYRCRLDGYRRYRSLDYDYTTVGVRTPQSIGVCNQKPALIYLDFIMKLKLTLSC